MLGLEWLKRWNQMNPSITHSGYQKQIIPLHSAMLQAHHCRAFLKLVNKRKSHTTLSLPSKRLSSVCLHMLLAPSLLKIKVNG